ncbi:PDR/VanB family oxidoreductase [Chromobacterium haemolyticum]|uniref:PDR/VanB family oxidoreductase n=1 Tax=Chromobacterium haemolyticum TaxID=394935 RepID=UPI004056490A
MSAIVTEVCAIEDVAAGVKAFTLRPLDGPAPPCPSGSHIVVDMPPPGRPAAYSLLDPGGGVYRIAVKREPDSRGGSSYLHALKPGSRLRVQAPANRFPLAAAPGPRLFIAGGIGITPFIAHMAALGNDAYQLHYAFRDAASAAFAAQLANRSERGDARVHLYESQAGRRLDLDALISAAPADSQVYVCGPERLIAATADACARRLPAGRLHYERFSADATAEGASFEVELARSGLRVRVGAEESILAAIERQTALRPDCLCREGYCGSCETRLLAGNAEHRDQYLSETERQERIMICVSRAAGSGPLVLDL